MKTAFSILTEHAKARGFKSLNQFFVKHDPSGSAYQTTMKKGSAFPRTERLCQWAELLSMTKVQTDELIRAANRERVFAAADGRELGPGIQVIRDDINLLERQLSDALKENELLMANNQLIMAELRRRGIEIPELNPHG